ncbi:MAG TPA: mechanosensitive ion channel domain-containing protein [Candidatus Nanoarchaeia archaeon]|nr:mechanosensitive ion channel domain-containing protein [Candidatus Nanoarchaeia archaeon]
MRNNRLASMRKKIMRKKIMNKRILFLLGLYLLTELFFYVDRIHLLKIPDYFTHLIESIVFVITTLLVISILLRLTSTRLFNALEGEMEIEQRIFVSKLYSFFLFFIGFALILWKFGVSVVNITIFLGLAASGFAFAIRDVLMAIFSWAIILNKKPFKIQDNVKIGDDIGEVTRIGTFYLTLQSFADSRNIIKIPNKILLEKSIENYGKNKRLYQITVPLQEIPKDIEDRIILLKQSFYKYVVQPGTVRVTLRYDGGNCLVDVALTGEALYGEIHNKMMIETYRMFKDVVKKGTSEKS